MQVETFRVGDIEGRIVVHGEGSAAPEWMFPDIPIDDLHKAMAPFVDDRGRLTFRYSSLVVHVADRLALIDTGPPPVAGSRDTTLAQALRSMGIAREDIDLVIISHGHEDHIGGMVGRDRNRPVLSFPAASHMIHRAELGHWMGESAEGGMAPEGIRLLGDTGRVELVDGEFQALPGLRLLPTPGHTPGHLSVVMTSGSRGAVYVGDALAHEVNVAHPEWNHFSDMLPGPAIGSRRSLVELAASRGHLILASHMVPRGRAITVEGEGHHFIPDESQVSVP